MILKVVTHGLKEYEINVEAYDSVTLNEQLNNKDINTVAIGELIISRIDVKNVVPVIEEVQ